MANVGKNIKKFRTNCKMTQDTLAEKLFVSRQTVSNYENGKSNPDIDMLVKMAEIFGTDVNTLIYGPPVPVDKKREYWKLGLVGAALAVLGIATAMLMKSGIVRWCYHRFIDLPLMIVYLIVYPGLYLMLGWFIMQIAGLFFGAKKSCGKYILICRKILVGILILYLVLLLPFFIDSVINNFGLWQAQQMHRDWESVQTIPVILQRPGEYIWFKVLISQGRYSVIYLFAGIFLWASAPTGKKASEPAVA